MKKLTDSEKAEQNQKSNYNQDNPTKDQAEPSEEESLGLALRSVIIIQELKDG